jgi:hypothetical protein
MRFLFQKCVFSIRGLKVRLFLFATMHPRRSNTSHSHVATIFCNHLAKLLQKIVASQTDPEIPDLKMLMRVRNAVWLTKRAIGIRGFRGLIPDEPTHRIRMLLLSFVIILQSCYKISLRPRKTNTSHRMLLLSFVTILQSCYKRSLHPRKPNTSDVCHWSWNRAIFDRHTGFGHCGEQKVALSALGENLLRKVVKKVDNAKITT